MKLFLLPINPALIPGKQKELKIDGASFHHLIRVRRLKVGDCIQGITRNGEHYEVLLKEIQRQHCIVILNPLMNNTKNSTENLPRITLIPGIAKGRKMDVIIRQSVESGVSAIWPIITRFSQVHLDTEAYQLKCKRWQRIADEAQQQCGGTFSTQITLPADLKSTINRWNKRGPIFFLHEKSEKKNGCFHNHLIEEVRNLSIMVGSEGGFAPEEVKLLEESGTVRINLGWRVLRAETAVIHGIAAITAIIRERETWSPVQKRNE